MIQGFKNIIKATSFLDQSFQQLLKKTDDNRKLAKLSLEHLQAIHRFLQSFSITFQRTLLQYNQISQEGVPFSNQFYLRLERVFAVQHECTKKLNGNIKQTIEKSNDIFNDYSNLIIAFQVAIRNYTNHLQAMAQSSKRYFRAHKSLISNLEDYKLSFTDVKLIYNTDERIKRYNSCELNYKALSEELKNIESKLGLLNQLKKEVISNYKNIQCQFVSAIKFIGNRMITLSEMFVFQYNHMFKVLTALLHQQPFVQSKFNFCLDRINQDQFITVEIPKQATVNNANYATYLCRVKPQFYSQIASIHCNLMKEICDKMEDRKKANRHLYQFVGSYLKHWQKLFNTYLRDLVSNYQKNKKKISQIYGKQHKFFLKTFKIVFEKIIEQAQALSKAATNKLKNTETIIQEEYKLIDSFLKELKSSSDKIVKKKTTKSQLDQDPNLDQQFMRLSAYQKSFFIKINQNQSQLSINYNGVMNDLSIYSHSLMQFCDQFYKQELDQTNFLLKYKQFQLEVDEIIKAKTAFFAELSFGNLLLDNNEDITFEPELNKIDEFKKIKKPAEYQSQKNGQIVRKGSLDEEDKHVDPVKKDNNEQIGKSSKQDATSKNEQFLKSKIVFEEGEKIIDTFKCGLSDKIILSGKLFVTNQRICFHSKFNPNNVFFGDTFLQIPKKDIIKVQKRQNAIIFNNSISITTVNGQVFFTSFFSRNEAYDLICQIFQINNNEDLMFETTQDLAFNNPIRQEQSEQDDLPEENITVRVAQIDPLIQQWDYIQIHQSVYSLQGLNAFKFFRIFEGSEEISYNRKTFKGFNMFLKQLLDHKDIVIGPWTPDLASFLNSSNLKQAMPLKFCKTTKSVIPVPNSGIPLMPKQAQMQEEMSLYFYSKDKYVLQTKIQNFGIPYCQYFSIRYKKVVETVEKNKCRMKLYFYMDFVQKTMMKSVIQSKSLEESKSTVARYQAEMKKYLKYLEKTQSKPNKHVSRQAQQQERIKQLEAQLQSARQCEQRMTKEAIISENNAVKRTNILYGSLLLNLVLIIVVASLY